MFFPRWLGSIEHSLLTVLHRLACWDLPVCFLLLRCLSPHFPGYFRISPILTPHLLRARALLRRGPVSGRLGRSYDLHAKTGASAYRTGSFSCGPDPWCRSQVHGDGDPGGFRSCRRHSVPARRPGEAGACDLQTLLCCGRLPQCSIILGASRRGVHSGILGPNLGPLTDQNLAIVQHALGTHSASWCHPNQRPHGRLQSHTAPD